MKLKNLNIFNYLFNLDRHNVLFTIYKLKTLKYNNDKEIQMLNIHKNY